MVQGFATTNKKTKGEYNVESRQRNVNYLRYVSINRGLCNCRTCVVDGRYVDNLYFNNKYFIIYIRNISNRLKYISKKRMNFVSALRTDSKNGKHYILSVDLK